MPLFKTIKTFTRNLIIGANIATVIIMILVGFSGQLNPESFPILSNACLTFPILLIINIAFLFFWILFYPKGVFVSILGLIISYVPVRTYCPLNMKSDKPRGCIKVMTYNVDVSMKTETDAQGKVTYPALEFIGTSGAHVVCVQEAYMTKEKAINLRHIYEYADTARNEHGGSCLTLFSKYPIINKEHIRLNSLNTCAAFYLKINEDTVIVVNCHLESNQLSLQDRENFEKIAEGGQDRKFAGKESKQLLEKLAEAAKIRAPQARKVAAYIREHSHYPMIVCGDFNDNPLSYARHTIAEGLTDCYVTTGNGPGWTFNRNRIRVRIDHILCSKDITPYKCRVENKIDVSDHHPVSCWLKIEPKSQKINN
ncbi:MAG: endonuclease/exonuclease/phosphatase family protein [Prevotella sp.]|nr:endonuclease/exonuclease/phosphatase family protein [Prevotella sp.]